MTSFQRVSEYSVLNSTRKILLEFSDINTNKHTFKLAELKSGLYMVKITTIDGYEQVEKVLKKD